MPAHPVMVPAVCPWLGQAPHTDDAGHTGAHFARQRTREVEQVVESVSRVGNDQVPRIGISHKQVLRHPCVADALAEISGASPL